MPSQHGEYGVGGGWSLFNAPHSGDTFQAYEMCIKDAISNQRRYIKCHVGFIIAIDIRIYCGSMKNLHI